MSEPQMYPLSAYIRIKHGFAFPGAEFSDDPSLPTLVTPGNFAIGGGFKETRTKTYAGEYPRDYKLSAGDLIVSMTDLSKEGDTLGLPAVVPEGDYLHNQRVGLVEIVAPESVDPRFLSYFFRTSSYRAHILGTASGSTVRHTSPSRIESFVTALPQLNEQQAIAEVLGSLDDKIAANAKLVSLLNAHMALEYDAALANGESRMLLGEVAKFHNRRRVPLSASERDKRRGAVPYYGASGVFGTVDEAIFDERLVLVGEDGSVVNADGTPVIQYIWGPAWVNNHAHVLTGVKFSTEVLFQAVARAQVAPLVTGAVQPKLNMGNLSKLVLAIPDQAYFSRLESVIGAETSLKRTAIEENRKLAAARGALLPQLMSGQLRVKRAEEALQELGV